MKSNRLIIVAGTLALICAPAQVGAATAKHRHHHHRYDAARAPAAPYAGGGSELHRIPSLDPPSCDSPNVISVENCRASMNGRR